MPQHDPIAEVQEWLDEARAIVGEQQSMTLATATPDGHPSARVVLLRGIDAEGGLSFFTNRTSRKGDELRRNPRAAIAIHWWELGRQIRVEGAVEEASEAESVAYWHTRPRGSQIAAWASPQSQPLERAELEQRVTEAGDRYEGGDVPLPPFWGGYRLQPEVIELWTHRDDRLHDRVRYVREDDGWRREVLAP